MRTTTDYNTNKTSTTTYRTPQTQLLKELQEREELRVKKDEYIQDLKNQLAEKDAKIKQFALCYEVQPEECHKMCDKLQEKNMQFELLKSRFDELTSSEIISKYGQTQSERIAINSFMITLRKVLFGNTGKVSEPNRKHSEEN